MNTHHHCKSCVVHSDAVLFSVLPCSASLCLRDYNSDADLMLQALNPNFSFKESQLYLDNVPEMPDPVEERMERADEQVSILNQDARKMQFEADTLALARDIAQLTKIYNEITKSEHAKRTEKIAHIRAQNTIGSSIVSDYMANNAAVMSGVIRDQMASVDRVRGCEHSIELFSFWVLMVEISCNMLQPILNN